MAIIVYNRKNEDHSHEKNNYPIFRGASILGNPYTHLPLKGTKAIYHVRTREEAIERYSDYFDLEYAHNQSFKEAVDEIYDKYKNGEDIYLECYCGIGDGVKKRCHGEVIAEKLQKILIKEFIKKKKENK